MTSSIDDICAEIEAAAEKASGAHRTALEAMLAHDHFRDLAAKQIGPIIEAYKALRATLEDGGAIYSALVNIATISQKAQQHFWSTKQCLEEVNRRVEEALKARRAALEKTR